MERFRSPALGWILAVCISAGMSLCCCSGKTLTSVLSQLSSVTLGAHTQESASGAREHAHSCCSSDREGGAGSGPCDDGAPCQCEQHKQVKQLPDSPAGVEFSVAPILVALPAALAPDISQSQWVPSMEVRRTPKPLTSLLRLHCALII